MTNVLEVDVTTLLITILNAAPDGIRTVSELPDKVENDSPVRQVIRVGGGNDGVILDSATFAIHAFAADAVDADAALYSAWTALRAARGVVTDGAVLTQVQTLSGPSWAPTENTALRHSVTTGIARIKVT